eukprot:Hpha_TRINITY_DN20389_c0_g1::TRINITY_DN20389_c0_g1_i1::g.138212::m.138212
MKLPCKFSLSSCGIVQDAQQRAWFMLASFYALVVTVAGDVFLLSGDMGSQKDSKLTLFPHLLPPACTKPGAWLVFGTLLCGFPAVLVLNFLYHALRDASIPLGKAVCHNVIPFAYSLTLPIVFCWLATDPRGPTRVGGPHTARSVCIELNRGVQAVRIAFGLFHAVVAVLLLVPGVRWACGEVLPPLRQARAVLTEVVTPQQLRVSPAGSERTASSEVELRPVGSAGAEHPAPGVGTPRGAALSASVSGSSSAALPPPRRRRAVTAGAARPKETRPYSPPRQSDSCHPLVP